MYFFFQAEDGIRDSPVTGVQTCALPILVARLPESARDRRVRSCNPVVETAGQTRFPGEESEIGRASCRERV